MRNLALAVLVFLVIGASANASSILNLPASFCPGMFPSNGLTNGMTTSFSAAGTYTGLLGIALLIVLMVFSALGIVYAFGYALNMESLKAFTRTEVPESVFNVILICLVFSGVAFAGGAIAFVANLGLVGIESISSGSAAPTIAPVPITSTRDIYIAICSSYIDHGVNVALDNLLTTSLTAFTLKSLMTFKVNMAPSWFGVSFQPFMGTMPISNLIAMQAGMFDAMVGLLIGVTFMLYLIYSIFPLFLYVGVLLRSFPWTRSAGGAFIALFISFYIIFPALLYPFSLYMQNVYAALGVSTGGPAGFSLYGMLAAAPLSGMAGDAMLAEISGFAQTVSYTAIQFLGLVIAFVVALDLMGSLGDLLGAPSLSSGAHANMLLKRVI
ncbi:Uncharacterised protein [uncultured archaeon]|nr:Uncharacterised protein [uncultured archaeon]